MALTRSSRDARRVADHFALELGAYGALVDQVEHPPQPHRLAKNSTPRSPERRARCPLRQAVGELAGHVFLVDAQLPADFVDGLHVILEQHKLLLRLAKVLGGQMLPDAQGCAV